jgi:hypothetical protein
MNMVLKYQDAQVRTVQQDGQAWFVLADVCDILGLSNPSRVAQRLPDEDKKEGEIDPRPNSGLGRLNGWIINEPGLYRVVLRSDKPETEPFMRWITHDILPSIRRHGFYVDSSWTMSTKDIARLTGYSHSTALRHIADALPNYRSAILTGRASKEGLQLNAVHAYLALSKLARGGVHFYLDQFPSQVQAIGSSLGTQYER